MGMLANLSGTTVEKKTQLIFYDDDSFEFKKREVDDMCLVEKKNGEIFRAWVNFYSAEFQFKGYKSIKAGEVTLSFMRDCILDPFNKVKEADTPTGGKPKANEKDIRKWTGQIAENQRYKVMNKPSNMLLINKITMFLGIALVLELIMMGISKAWG